MAKHIFALKRIWETGPSRRFGFVTLLSGATLAGVAAILPTKTGLPLFSPMYSRHISTVDVSDLSAADTPLTGSQNIEDHECNCAPVWECIQSEKGNCEHLVQQLKACVALQKMK